MREEAEPPNDPMQSASTVWKPRSNLKTINGFQTVVKACPPDLGHFLRLATARTHAVSGQPHLALLGCLSSSLLSGAMPCPHYSPSKTPLIPTLNQK